MPRGQTRTDVPSKPKRKVKSEAYLKYQRYIRGKDFDEVRKAVFARDNYHCQFCNWCPDDYDPDKPGTHRTLSIHHRTYSNLFQGGQAEVDTCITLCDRCHRAGHACKANLNRFKKPD